MLGVNRTIFEQMDHQGDEQHALKRLSLLLHTLPKEAVKNIIYKNYVDNPPPGPVLLAKKRCFKMKRYYKGVSSRPS